MKIKQLITIIYAATLISCAPQPALAKEPQEPQVSKEEFCTSSYELAEQIMIARQSGVPLTRLLSLVNNDETATPDLKKPGKRLSLKVMNTLCSMVKVTNEISRKSLLISKC